jgi:hypothetical protein
MEQSIAIALSILVVYSLVLLLGKKFKLSSRYERKPRVLNTWSALDEGIDPTVQDKE